MLRFCSVRQEGRLRQADDSHTGSGGFTVTVTPHHGAQPRQSKFLLDFGRALALTGPDVPIDVEREHATWRWATSRCISRRP